MLSLGWVLIAGIGGAAVKGDYEVREHEYTGGPYKKEVFQYSLLKPSVMEEGKKYPLVLFLHGAGERGDNPRRALTHFPELMASAEYRQRFQCFVLVPQCRQRDMWVDADWNEDRTAFKEISLTHQMHQAVEILAKEVQRLPVDPRRIYLTGLSLGGYGSWELAARHPDWFAAVAPICGGGDARHADRLKSVKLWAVHGDADNRVKVEQSRDMIEAIKKAGGSPKYTELKGVGHDSWTPAYKDPKGVLPWMFEQVNPVTPKIVVKG